MDTTWSTTTRVLVIVVMLGLGVWLAVAAAPLVQTIGIAALLAYLLDPAKHWLMRRTRMRRSWASALICLLLVLILASIPAVLGTVAVTQMYRLEEDFLTAVAEITHFIAQPIFILNYSFHPQDILGNMPVLSGDILALLPSGSLNILSGATTNALWATAVLATLYYLLIDGYKIKPWLVGLAPAAYQPEIRRLLDGIDHIWGEFLRIQILIFIILFILAVIGTLLVVWLFRSGLLQWSFLGFVLLLLLVYIAVQQVDNLWLRPQFLGKQLHIHPGIVFVGLIGALALSGVFGALIIVPLIATAVVIGRYVHQKLLGLPPWPAEEISFDSSDLENMPD